jgi:hypothetical protein
MQRQNKNRKYKAGQNEDFKSSLHTSVQLFVCDLILKKK